MVQDMKKFTTVTSKKDKRTIIRKNKKHGAKHCIFNKVVSYLLSDSYMYSPLVSSQPCFHLPPPKQLFPSPGIQEDVALPIKGRNKKLIEKVVNYLEADCYMYAPLIDCNNQHLSSKSHVAANKDPGGDELRRQVGSGTEVKKSAAYRETVKRMV